MYGSHMAKSETVHPALLLARLHSNKSCRWIVFKLDPVVQLFIYLAATKLQRSTVLGFSCMRDHALPGL